MSNAEIIRDAIGGRRQRVIARAMGISDQYLSDILHNRRLISVNAALAFERTLNLDAAALLYRQCLTQLLEAKAEL